MLTAEAFSRANPQEDLTWNIELITAETYDAAEVTHPHWVEDPYQNAPVVRQVPTSRTQDRHEATREALRKAREILDRMNQKEQLPGQEQRSPNHPRHHDDASVQRDDLHRRL